MLSERNQEDRCRRGSARDPYAAFLPIAYLEEYYAAVGRENRFLLAAIESFYAEREHVGHVLEFGAGPTVYQLLSPAWYAASITVSEYLPENRRALTHWLESAPQSFSWKLFIETLAAMRATRLTEAEVRKALREKTTAIISCDCHLEDLFLTKPQEEFDVVSTHFCLECISPERTQYEQFVKRLLVFVRPGGALIMSSLLGARAYQVGSTQFPACPLTVGEIVATIEGNGFAIDSCATIPAEHRQGYDGIATLTATKRAQL